MTAKLCSTHTPLLKLACSFLLFSLAPTFKGENSISVKMHDTTTKHLKHVNMQDIEVAFGLNGILVHLPKHKNQLFAWAHSRECTPAPPFSATLFLSKGDHNFSTLSMVCYIICKLSTANLKPGQRLFLDSVHYCECIICLRTTIFSVYNLSLTKPACLLSKYVFT